MAEREVHKFSIPFEPPESLCCFSDLCDFRASSLTKLLSHYRTCHRNDKYFSSACLYSTNCFHSRKFGTFSALYTHLRTYHPSFDSRQSYSTGIQADGDNLSNDNDEDASQLNDVLSQEAVDTSEKDGKKEVCNAKDWAARFILDLLAEEKLAQSTVQTIVLRVENLISNLLLNIADSQVMLKDRIMPTPKYYNQNEASELFKGLRTKTGIISYFQNNFGLILPERIKLPLCHNRDFARHRQGRDQYFREQSYQLIPLIKQLEQLLNVHEIFSSVYDNTFPEQTSWTKFTNLEDGIGLRRNKFFHEHPNALQIILYLDEVQMCNPLGSRSSKKNKVVLVYFSLGNLEMKNRSSFHSIYLLSIFTSQQMDEFGLNLLLHPIIEDIKKLEEGAEMELQGESVKVFGTLAVVVADNLASHQIGGFKTGFARGFRKCRFCLATADDINNKFCQESFIQKNREDHDMWCELIDSASNASEKEHYSKVYGIRHKSILNDLKYFHVIEGLPPDAMHDILEGIMPKQIAKLVYCLVIQKKLIKLNQINHMIQNFMYGPNEIKSKPALIKLEHLKKHSLRQSSSQIWTLATILPLLIGKVVPMSMKRWQAFLQLLEISRIVFSDSLSFKDIFHLKDLVYSYLTKMCKLNEKITPKMHHLVHYPHSILLYGPLKNYWAMRYEGKHASFKKIVRVTNNFINLPFTLAYRHQIWLVHKLASSKNNLFKPLIQRPKKVNREQNISVSSFPYGGQVSEALNLTGLNSFVTPLPWISVNFSKITPGKTVILCPLKGSVLNKFGKVIKIIETQTEEKTLVACQMLTTLRFEKRFQAYKVKQTAEILVFDLLDLNLTSTFTVHQPGFAVESSELFILAKQQMLHLLFA